MPAQGLLKRLHIQQPIFLAPLAGGPSTPELAATVSNAGGLGAVGLEYLTLDQMRAEAQRARELTSGPLNLNLFAPVEGPGAYVDSSRMIQKLNLIHQELGIAPPQVPDESRDVFEEKLAIVLELHPEVFSFTFGMISQPAMLQLKQAGIFVIGTATTVEEAGLLEASGVDAIVAQGAEAGGHRGTFAAPFEKAMVPTIELVTHMVHACSVPVIASGGIMDGHDIKRALAAGAEAVQLGTAFLASPESGASKAYKQAILSADTDTTVITRAYSGRPARGLNNRFASDLAKSPHIILPFPLQNTLTRPMRKAAAAAENHEYLSLWAGTGVARAEALPAGELIAKLVRELNE
jgi:nitronate monooxygenase